MKRYSFLKNAAIAILSICCLQVYGQCPDQKVILKSLNAIEDNEKLTSQKKLQQYYDLKLVLDKCDHEYDSVYAKLLLKIGVYEFKENKNYQIAIQNTVASIKINNSAKNKGSKYLAARGCFNVAYYYNKIGLSNKSLSYYDSAIALAKAFPDTTDIILYAKFNKVVIYFQNGDYQKTIEGSIEGMHYSLQKKDSSTFLDFLKQKAQSLYFENKLSQAIIDVETIIALSKESKYSFQLATSLKLKAMIQKKNRNFLAADTLFNKAINIRSKTDEYRQISLDYIDYGNFLLDCLHNYKKAKSIYAEALFYAKKADDSSAIALATLNTGAIYLYQKLYAEADNYNNKAIALLKIAKDNDGINFSADNLDAISSKNLPVIILTNKIEILLGLYYKNKDENILVECMKICFMMDKLTNKMRNMQIGNESKLYWRDYTHDFYRDAIQTSFLLKRSDYAFYFMEKSRAVLLGDKLNELNASSYLSVQDDFTQENFKIKIIELQQQISSIPINSKEYQIKKLKLVSIKDESEKFIKSLEEKYPAYYQYKYEDKVPDLKELQSFLAKNNQSFVHYFIGDTVTYILGITATSTKFLRLSQKEFNKATLFDFLKLCANKQALNNNYNHFAALSNSIYKTLFEELDLPNGRVIICMDDIVIPFDALCKDAKGKQFLLNSYSFDYAYSARFLMKEFKSAPAKGNFAGFAPVSFAKSLNVVDLKNAATALNASAAYYSNDKLFTHQNATRHNFFRYVPSYSVVSIFSHAFADTTDNEPVLFMQDSLIHLSELQTLNNPATKLVLLSACQTNVGKTATGEGIYSLARGFATAGIPSVAATLWKADEETIYAVSEKFNQYLSEGMNKDEALQKAKLYFIQHSSSEKMLPFFWANMILIGNADAIKLTTTNSNIYIWIVAACILAVAAAIISLRKKRRKTF